MSMSMEHTFAEDVVDTARSAVMFISMAIMTTTLPTFTSQSSTTRSAATNAKTLTVTAVINMPTTVTSGNCGRGIIAAATSTTMPLQVPSWSMIGPLDDPRRYSSLQSPLCQSTTVC